MRVTPSISYRNLLENLRTLNERLDEAGMQVASGRRLSSLRDSAADSAVLVQLKSELTQIDQFRVNTESGEFQLRVTDSTLSAVFETVTRIFERGSAGANGNLGAAERAVIAGEVRALRDHLFGLANTQLQGRYIFAGTNVRVPAFSIAGDVVSYQGNAEINLVKTNSGSDVRVNVPGSPAFDGLFAGITQLLVALDNNDETAIKQALGQFRQGMDALGVVRARVGADLQRTLNDAANLDARETDLKMRRLELESVDMAEAITRMAQAQNGLRAAMTAGSRVQQENLFDFLA